MLDRRILRAGKSRLGNELGLIVRLRFWLALLLAGMLPVMAQPASAPVLDAAQARQVREMLTHAGDDGLDPRDYAGMDAVDALSRYLRDLRAGRAALRALDADVLLPRDDFDVQAVLAAALRRDALAGLVWHSAPPHPDYAALKAALARYRAIAAAGGWAQLSAADVAKPRLLRQRLAFEDDTAARRDVTLADAVRRFQARHGLAEDGKVGPKTLAELNVPAAARAQTLAANMERWRWMPRGLEKDRIEINVPEAQLRLWLDGRLVLASRVVVGRPGNPTPILRAEAASVTLNPPWNIPASIAAAEILPRLKRNPAWLARNDMVLTDGPPGDPQGLRVKWRGIPAGTFPFHIRQYPGPRNPLGRIKLELPNRFEVYLHDTPDKAAFARPGRALSHGCVRVEQILPLASYAVTGDALAADGIVQAIASGETRNLPLRKTLPVYFLYWTAFAGPDGVVQFRPDLYGRDRRLIAAMMGDAPVALAAVAGCAKG